MTQGASTPSGSDRSEDEQAGQRLRERIEKLETEIARHRSAAGERQSRLLQLQRRVSRSERLAALAALVGSLARDLGTPLHSIGGHLDLLSRDPGLSESARHRIEIAAGEVDRLCGMLREQLETLRTPSARPVPTDINECVTRVATLLEPSLAERGIGLTLDLDPDAAAPFLCDPAHIEQAVVNLLQNAMDALTAGGVLVLHTAATGAGRTLSVADSGAGMDAEVVAHASEPFFSTKEPGRATGLGLMICDDIAHAHGGELWIDSKPGMGTVVTLSLAHAAATDSADAEDPAAHG